MVFDFSFVLVALAALTGAVWGLDTWLFAARRRERGTARDPVLVDYARSFFPVIVIVLVLRSFLYEPFRIPSDSMMPTLIQGDFIFVNKWRYGLRLPVLNTRILEIGEPQRGDVVVFRKPTEPSIVFIKRLVGLPGDVISVTASEVLVNGTPSQIAPGELYSGPKSEQYPFSRVGEERLGEAAHAI
ncbi:MAG: signal peptidase I, partial [Acidobacteria bacterium]